MSIKPHALKSWPHSFHAMKSKIKTADYRINDRDYQVNDFIVFSEFNPDNKKLTGDQFTARILYIEEGPSYGIPQGYCILNIEFLYEGNQFEQIEEFEAQMRTDKGKKK